MRSVKQMVAILETKSNKVKGLSFHSKEPLILTSLYSGGIQLWDCNTHTLIHEFLHEHNYPVRSVHFHRLETLFVSGGDDYNIKVWDYNSKRCLLTLVGHSDYISTVEFHHNNTWILSSSADQTIRIWNWQSRTCILELTGHSHIVMCASFHPKEALVVSASLDKTVRVWDIRAVGKKTVSPDVGILRLSKAKYVFKGHKKGVNWASFHPTLPQIVSAADDNHVKIWDMNDTQCQTMHTLEGHMDGVSCAMFHSRKDIIVSTSGDKSIRVWDATEKTCLWTFQREGNRFSILSVHPLTNLLAAGHDSGMIVFKSERERPAFIVSGDSVFYVKDQFLHSFEYSTRKDTQRMPICEPGSNSLNQGPRTLSYSPTKNAILVCSDVDGGSYELYIIPNGGGQKVEKRGVGGSAVFVARNRFAVLDKSSNQVLVKNMKNAIVRKSVLPIAADAIFYAGTGNILCRAKHRVMIFGLQQSNVLGDCEAPFVRFVVWAPDMDYVALLSKKSIVITDKKLGHRFTILENTNVKSGAWDDNGIFIYTTLEHIMYHLPNGNRGIIQLLDAPLYITKIKGNRIFCLDRKGGNYPIIIDSTVYSIMLYPLEKRHYEMIIELSKQCGQARIPDLQNSGFQDDALDFVKRLRTCFNLAFESGNIEKVLQFLERMDRKDQWEKLAIEALRRGNVEIAEHAYKKAKNFSMLSHIYLITGNREKLFTMIRIARIKGDVTAQFLNALYLGWVEVCIIILFKAGHIALSMTMYKLHKLIDLPLDMRLQIWRQIPFSDKNAYLLIPPRSFLCAANWPLKTVFERVLDGGHGDITGGGHEDYKEAADADLGKGLDKLD